MRLRSLELKGFKSFADQTVIHFNEDVIGIVGPNGSGKSNIVDAIRWVLGEQKNKELRLDKMSSVIFNGTKKRKPTGMASVALTFDNTKNLLPTEYQTVTISRHLYRSGESEYRINDVVCRLKDIRSMFLDTGIGSDSYAIIALGMVDDILHDKENSRRGMLEQASGILKYKIRKRETLNKLNRTTEDLDRVEDLLFELNNQLKDLEKQARRTQRYFDLQEKYKNLSLDLAHLSLRSLHDDHENVNKKKTELEDKHNELQAAILQIESRLEAEKKKQLDEEKLLSAKQRAVNDIVNEAREREGDKKMAKQNIDFARQNLTRLQKEIEANQGTISSLVNEVNKLKATLSSELEVEVQQRSRFETIENELASIRERHGRVKGNMEELIARQQSAEGKVIDMEKRMAVLHAKQDNIDLEEKQLLIERENRVKEINETAESLKDVSERESILEEKLQQLREKKEKREERRNTLLEREKNLQNDLIKVNRRIDARKNELDLLQSMVDNLEGFPESVKFLAKNKDWSGKAPLLSDIIYCDEDYRVCIENYLDQFLNYYIVETYEEALKGVSLLRDAQKGKANFFVLDAVATRKRNSNTAPGTTAAIDHVKCDDKYKDLMQFLLNGVDVIEEPETAKPWLEKEGTYLAKDGSFSRRPNILSGGSVGLFEGKKIGRKKHIEILEKDIKKFEKEAVKLLEEIKEVEHDLSELNAASEESDLESIREQKQEIVSRKMLLENKLNGLNENAQKDQNRQQELEDQRTSYIAELNTIESQIKVHKQEIKEVKASIQKVDDDFQKEASALSDKNSAFNEERILLIRQENKIKAVQQELEFKERQLQNIQERLQNDADGVEENKSRIEELEKRLIGLDEEIKGIYRRKEAEMKHLSLAEQEYYRGREELTQLEDTVRKKHREQQELGSRINDLKDKLTNLRMRLNSLNDRVQIEFKSTLEELADRDVSDKFEREELQQKCDRMKNRLENYGEINPMAVEAFNEMKERYDGITVQRDDILDAKESLMDTIKEIEESATAKFLEAFGKVKANFQEVFHNLFTEDDDCDLVLEDPENPLESKINIIAKPKGKRPQSISQLSGGEKTLTATAFLFALYLYKPAPFCIFDEVDAPLDDANIQKFNRIIKKFSKDSQFIIVTHNKLTMEAVDVIYGVYMPEQGVSNVSGVDFRELTVDSNFAEVAG